MPAANSGLVIRSTHAGVQRLKPNAVGLVADVSMAVATAGPITAMVGNAPIAAGFGHAAVRAR